MGTIRRQCRLIPINNQMKENQSASLYNQS